MSDEQIRALVRAYDRCPDRIQGFLYGTRLVIRDLFKPWGEQEIWSRHVSECSDEEFQGQCRVEWMRVALAEAGNAK